MRILEINTRYRYGGSPPRIVYELGQYLRAKGHDVYTVYGYDNQKTDAPTDPKVYRMGPRVIRHISNMQTRLMDGHGFHNTLETKKMLKWVEHIEPDVIHIHNLHGYYIHIELLFQWIRAQNIPVVFTLHDCWMLTGHCTVFDHIGCERWKTGCGNCPALREYPQTLFLDRSKEQFNRKHKAVNGIASMVYVTPSKWLKGLLEQSHLSACDVRVINNGIDTVTFAPKIGNLVEEYHLQGKKVVLSVANIYEERKGSGLIYKLPSMLPEDYAVILIGRIPEADAGRVSPQCICIPRTESVKELAQWYTAADVFINPTLTDNFPTVNLEALACGTPVVTYRTGGSPEAVDATTGRVVEKGDEAGFVAAIIEMAHTSCAEACRSRALRLYDKNANYEQYEMLFCEMTSVMEGKKRGAKLAENR